MFKRFTLIAAVILAGCSEGENIVSDVGKLKASSTAVSLSPEQRKLRERERDYAKARVNAAATGAVIAGIGCLLGGCDAKKAIAAAAIGGAAGYVGGSYLTRKDRNFRASQESLQADIKEASKDNVALQENVVAAQATLNYQRSEITRLNQAFNAGNVKTAAYRASYKQMQGDLQSTRRMIERAQKNTDRLSQDASRYRSAGFGTGNLDRELAQQREKLKKLQAVEHSMVAVLNGVPASVRGTS